jgi:hypothetical protein
LNKIVNDYSNSVALDGNPEPNAPMLNGSMEMETEKSVVKG